MDKPKRSIMLTCMEARKFKIDMIKDWNSAMEQITFYISKGIQ
jgi:hypothetical protein